MDTEVLLWLKHYERLGMDGSGVTLPEAPIRVRDLALTLENSTKAEIWSIHLAQRTLAKGKSLLDHICRAKLVNNIELTEEEDKHMEKYHRKREYNMSLPYAPNCTNGQGIRQSHLATGYIISPTGRRIGAMCESCAQEVIDEYREKLGQVWTFEPQEWQQVDLNRPAYTYGNPYQDDEEPVSNESISVGYSSGTLIYKEGSLFPSEHVRDGLDRSESIPSYVDPKDLQLQRICAYTDTRLIENTIKSEIDCPWCEALPGDVHARICPNGERWAQAKEIRDSAASLGKLGGKTKTEKKSKAAKENGKRGGRPQSTQLDMDDI